MNTRVRFAYIGCLISGVAAVALFATAPAQPQLEHTPDGTESVFRFDTEAGRLYRIDTSADLRRWQAVRTVSGNGSPFAYSHPRNGTERQTFFRAVALAPGTGLTGDYLATAAGDVLIHPVDHASFVLQWDGKTIYNDPVGGGAAYSGIPPADLILIGHRHGDHLNTGTIDAVRRAETPIIVPADVLGRLSAAQQALAIALANGEGTTAIGLSVDAVPAYNSNHPEGRDNGYIVTIGDKRIYMSGDTGDTSEMRALQDIDLAFLAMNVPFTMSIDQAASATREFKPRAVYPYHYRNGDGSLADLVRFRELVGDDLGVEVRLRDWYR